MRIVNQPNIKSQLSPQVFRHLITSSRSYLSINFLRPKVTQGNTPFEICSRIVQWDKARDKAKIELTDAIGGDVSPQQAILIDKAVFLLYKTSVFESQMMNGSEIGQDVESYYLAWVNSLRRILEALGLKKAQKTLKDIFTYSDEKFGKKWLGRRASPVEAFRGDFYPLPYL